MSRFVISTLSLSLCILCANAQSTGGSGGDGGSSFSLSDIPVWTYYVIGAVFGSLVLMQIATLVGVYVLVCRPLCRTEKQQSGPPYSRVSNADD